MQRCRLCGVRSPLIMRQLAICGTCMRTRFEEARPLIEIAHAATRREFGLPEKPPKATGGCPCHLCARQCVIGPEERGYCGLRINRANRLVHLAGTPERGLLHWYRDPLPTNCVAEWVCAASRHQPSHPRSVFGLHNLAVFYSSCTFNCLFCQNWHFREADPRQAEMISADQLASCANARTFCVCFFGGDPASQMPHALATARRLAERNVVICWETSGAQHPRLMEQAVRLSFQTGGTVKFDLKAYHEEVHFALTGANNRRTLENFARAAQHFDARPDPPLVVASTLLVPGYVTPDEVAAIARFIAQINPHIPYALLAFAPQFYAADLPFTSVRHAEEALQRAQAAGLTNVRIGNRHILAYD
ncbi:MAG: radical SAM protein [Anaerolineae bacterium]